MFKIKRKDHITEVNGVKIGMIVEVNGELFEITSIRAESWGYDVFKFVAKGRAIPDVDGYEHNLFLCENFYEHVINNIVKVVNDGTEDI
jgi:hypothetical protein